MNNFAGIKYFKPTSTTDAWGDPSQISAELLQKLDKFRDYIKAPVFVTSGFRPNSQDSQHALGLAVDIVCPTYAGKLMDLYLAAERFGFTGIGIYPGWNYQGRTVGGLHLDVRTGGSARWMGVPDGKGGQKYLALKHETLKLWGVL